MAATAVISPLAHFHLDSRDSSHGRSRAKAPASLLPEQTFRLFDLPFEIRSTIYDLALFAKPGKHIRVRRARRGGHSRLALLSVSRRVHDEAAYIFYTGQVFRVFALQDFKPLPTVRDLQQPYRQFVTSIELILGHNWTKVPQDWKVTPKLGLQDMTRLQTVQIFVELDPSHPSLAGFRVSEGYYTDYAGKILHDILATLPSVKFIQIDMNPSVQPTGPLVSRLLQEAAAAQVLVKWGTGPKGRASDNVFVELMSRYEPWLKPAYTVVYESDLPRIVMDAEGKWVLSAPPPRHPVEDEDDEDENASVTHGDDSGSTDPNALTEILQNLSLNTEESMASAQLR